MHLPYMHLIYFLFLFLGASASLSQPKELDPLKEKKSFGWQVLFNGKDLEGWIPKIHHHEVGENYANTFRVRDGAIEVNYDGYGDFENRFGHLFYEKPFSNFHLVWEYRFTDQFLSTSPSYTFRNSGVMFHSQAVYPKLTSTINTLATIQNCHQKSSPM